MLLKPEYLEELNTDLIDLGCDILGLELLSKAPSDTLEKYPKNVIDAYTRRHHDYINQRTEEIRTLTGFLFPK